MVQKSKKLLKLLLKIALTFGAFWVVFSKVSLEDVSDVLKTSNIWYLSLAFVFFNLSKITSAVRLNYYFSILKIKLDWLKNLILYYIGMFYNLFLPGGIGGDGYKIYLLKKEYGAETKRLIAATVLDRISGLIPLLVFLGVFYLLSSFRNYNYLLNIVDIISLFVVIPAFYLVSKLYFPLFMPVFNTTLLYGFLVQFLQIVCAYFIFLALGIDHYMMEFMFFFLLSSIVAVLPITVGGAGARELVFLYGLNYLHLDTTIGIAFALLFFLISALSSLIGSVFKNPFAKEL